MTFRTKALLFALAAALFGAGYDFYRQSPYALVGHWHVHMVEEGQGLRDGYMVLDIDKTLFANFEGIRGCQLSFAEPDFNFAGEGFSYVWKYEVRGEKMVLTDTKGNVQDDAIAYRCTQNDCCDPEVDYFRSDPVIISLPFVND